MARGADNERLQAMPVPPADASPESGRARLLRRHARATGARALASAAMVAAVATVACGGLAGQGRPGAAGPTPSAAAPERVVTEADSGRTIQLAAGEQLRLRLSDRYAWTEPRASGSSVRLVPVTRGVEPGSREWDVSGAAAGTATVMSSAQPRCTPGTICPHSILAFSVTLVVT